MKVVLDSSVMIAAFATKGFCHEIFELCLIHHEIYLCREILEEVRTKLAEKFKFPPKTVSELIQFLKDETTLVIPEIVPPSACRDPKDLMVLGTAVACQAELIITGDKDLLTLERYRGAQIVGPRSFWDLYR